MVFYAFFEIANYYNIFMGYIKTASRGIAQLVLKLQ